ncbi:sugar phosphate isomerase/epimerase [Ammoniphilus sp. CFH 90114]|uniref:sugar phosphate isomerase/epimerase family protein n=1 Tax=Ammoniphilus sp. CFH 90114 TaxID=2493665 RepID=UPI00100F0DF9|nr:sugar phosphate isomerase/epimerase [Ammoniphilus sp. CFH 90114]RXT15361.1 sugar phosphate isomerase/epimerase [Ammoniphilus sp. CFH 90114]
MKLGIFTVLFGDKNLEEALDYIQSQGLETVEIGVGGYPGKKHADAATLIGDEQLLNTFKQAVVSRGLEISAISCHGNPLHPDAEVADAFHQDFLHAVLLAEKLGVETVIGFSGCPGESDSSKNPVWVTCAWPPEHVEVLEWQWKEKVIPYWKEMSQFMREHGVRVAIEPHPGFVVYNTETALRLREEAGDNIGVNFDPSHLYWQQMDPVECIKELGKAKAIYHFHAKDTAFDTRNVAINGVLDTKSYRDELTRSWIFRTVGYGHGEEEWRRIISALQLIGYDGAISIEHEDSLMSIEEGFEKAVTFLKSILIRQRIEQIWWA